MACRHCYNGAAYCAAAIWHSARWKMRRIDVAQKDTIVTAILNNKA